MKTLSKLSTSVAACALTIGAYQAHAAATPGQITPVAVYHNARSAFGMAFDTSNNLIWFTQGDSGDNLIHSLKPFNSYTPAELAALPDVGGVKQVSTAAGQLDVAGTTAVAGPGGSGSGAHFSSLAFDSTVGKIVYQSSVGLKSVNPFGGGEAAYGAGNAGFTDGLDIDGGNLWRSPDVGDIFKNGALFSDNGNPALDLPSWTGLGSANTLGWSGVEQVGGSIFAVAVQSGSDTGRSRTIVKIDATTGDLLGYDPDGDPVAARWEDLAFDGRYLYAADLRGNANGDGVVGDIYVFDTGGGIVIEPPPVGAPDAGSTVMLLGLAFGSLLTLRRKC